MNRRMTLIATLIVLVVANAGMWMPAIVSPTAAVPEPMPPGVTLQSVQVPDLHELVQIDETDDVERLRGEILQAVFGRPELPASLPAVVESAEAFVGFAARRLTIPLVTGEQQLAHYIEPRQSIGRLAIYHAGHKQAALTDGAAIIQALLETGFHVLAFDMLPGAHERYANLERPLEPFLEHVAVGLNYALAEREFDSVVMLGLSGGGWTTVLYAALDPRISRSYPVAGSYPNYLRDQQPSSVGDFEQQLPRLAVDYLDLYLMASSAGRRQVQIFNFNDSCCFSGGLARTYHDFTAARASEIGGSFDVVIDPSDKHEISAAALRLVLSLQ